MNDLKSSAHTSAPRYKTIEEEEEKRMMMKSERGLLVKKGSARGGGRQVRSHGVEVAARPRAETDTQHQT